MYEALQRSFEYLKGSFSKYLALTFRFLVLGLLFYFIFIQVIAALNNELVQINLYGSSETGYKILFFVNSFYFAFMLLLIYSFFYVSNETLYHSLKETITADALVNKINTIGNTRRIKGLIRE
jgi:hypothetical protein